MSVPEVPKNTLQTHMLEVDVDFLNPTRLTQGTYIYVGLARNVYMHHI